MVETKKPQPSREWQETGERYISALEKIGASREVIDAAKSVSTDPRYEQRRLDAAAGRLPKRQTIWQRFNPFKRK